MFKERPLRRSTATALAIAFLSAFAYVTSASAQTFSVLHTFAGGLDGATPQAGMVLDRGGNFYGTTSFGGCSGGQCLGNVFRLKHSGSGWILTPLHAFLNHGDGQLPSAVAIGPDGSLFGTTWSGGGGCDPDVCGITYNLRPLATACTSALCDWTESILYVFSEGQPSRPGFGPPAFDHSGNLYLTTTLGGYGAVTELLKSNGIWSLLVLHEFNGFDGNGPQAGVIFDGADKLYGTTTGGGTSDYGTAYQLTPSGSGWTLQDLYSFQGQDDGQSPVGGLILDSAGNLYGTTTNGGLHGGGTVFELSPTHGSWTLTTIYSFAGTTGPYGSLAMDSSGALFGLTLRDGAYSLGSVFKLTPSGGSWNYSDLHDFTGGADGSYPYGNVVIDGSGNVYGTASQGGAGDCTGGCGVVWEITP